MVSGGDPVAFLDTSVSQCCKIEARCGEARCDNEGVSFGRTLIALGLILLVVGVIFTFGEKLPIRLGRLPGDIVIRGKNSMFYFPLVTCLLISVVLSFLLWLFGRR